MHRVFVTRDVFQIKVTTREHMGHGLPGMREFPERFL
jgi:hypothetical protein